MQFASDLRFASLGKLGPENAQAGLKNRTFSDCLAGLLGALVLVGWSPLPDATQAPANIAAYQLVGSTASRPTGIAVDGNRLVDRTGTTVVLRGVNMSGTEYACAQNHSDDPFGRQPEDNPETFASMRSWHINAVRIPLNEDCWLGINGVRVGGGAYQAAISSLVRDLEDSGFYVILDLHWSAPGTQRALSQNPAPDEDHSPAFWASVASAFKNDDDVIFDLFNEPHLSSIPSGDPSAWECLWKGCELETYETGGSPGTVTGRWSTAGMDQLIRVVRATGAHNLVLVAGLDWANDLSGWLNLRPKDSNLAASWHAYEKNRCSTEKCWEKEVAPVARAVPVVLTETGDSATGPASYLPRLLPWCDSHGISYLAWTWNAWPQKSNVLVTNMLTGSPTRGEGTYYRSHLQSLWRRDHR